MSDQIGTQIVGFLTHRLISVFLSSVDMYSDGIISANGSRQRLFLAILFHISKRAWHALVNNLLFFHMQVRFLYSHFPSAPWKPKYKGPMRPHFRTPVPNSTNAIRSVKFTYKEVKETLLCV